VISIIVYGRNDAHGYNLHRRAALSLNCIAEALTDPDDEIVFVDYNTPDELPTFVEALADTLTDRCLGVLRVIRVPAAIHEQRFAARTHLPAIEPVARNAGVRRANPSNRWLLSTNTDMILLPHSDQSLSQICSELPDGFYGLPRFELPEWLWERLPRSDPGRAMAEIERLGPELRLDEPTVSNEWIRFDAPGDFQLILREDFLAIDGLDEEMLLGYHVDSNLSRRMLLLRGSIESLGKSLAGYHCNHNREPTVYHGAGKVTNDLERFVVAVDQPELPAQRATWGLADAAVEEVQVRERSGLHLAATLVDAIPNSTGPRMPSDAARVPFELTYDSGHVLPFIADSLAVSPPDATIGYLGVNTVLEPMLATAVARLGFRRPLEAAKLDDVRSVDEVARTADVFVVDLGVDASLVDATPSTVNGYEPAQFPARLDLALAALERLIELERGRLELGEHLRRIVLVHSWTVFWDAYVLAHLDCSHTTAHSRVRRATVKPIPSSDAATRTALERERRLVRWAARGFSGPGRMQVRAGEPAKLADLSDYGGFGEGWSYPDEGGVWTQGSRSELAVALDRSGEGDVLLAFSIGSVCVGSDAPLRAQALVNGELAASRVFRKDEPNDTWHIELPARVVTASEADLTFVIEEPRTPRALGWSDEDERPLGIQLRKVNLVSAGDAATKAALLRERRLAGWALRDAADQGRFLVQPGEPVELAEVSDFGGFREGWSYPDEEGLWTQGSRSELALALEGVGEGAYLLALGLSSVCVGSDAPLRVGALVNGAPMATRDFTEDDPNRTWHIELPAHVVAAGEADLTLVVEEPRTPRAIGWSADDDRPLGILLRSVKLAPADDMATKAALVREGRLVRWAGRGERGPRRFEVRLAEAVQLADASDFGGFRGGWSYPDEGGIWTQGSRSELAITFDGGGEGDHVLALSLGRVCVGSDAPLRVEALVNGEREPGREFAQDEPNLTWQIELPASVVAAGKADLTFVIDEPRSPLALGWSADDDRPLGIQLRTVTLKQVDRSVLLGEEIVFAEDSGGERLLGDGWSRVEPTGVWTVSDKASLILNLSAAPLTDAELVLRGAAFVTSDHPELDVQVSAGDERLASRVFRHGEAHRPFRVPLPAAARDETGKAVLELHVRDPARPVDLGLSDDARRLGLHLRSLTVRRSGWRATLSDAVRETSTKLRKRLHVIGPPRRSA
jgi:hypothetical protein